MDNHLIGIDDFLSLARQASKHLDEKEVMRYVEECEDMYIIQAIGLDKFNDLTKSSVSSEDLILLSGGTFKNANGENEKCFGLKRHYRTLSMRKCRWLTDFIVTGKQIGRAHV